MLKVLHAGIIGLGVGEAHLRAYQSHPQCKVVGVCDLDVRRLDEVAEKYNVPFRTTSAQELIERHDIDVLSVCSYDNFHAEQVIAALCSGKHVMVEKPLCLNREEARAVLVAALASKRKLTCNLILRGSPRFRRLKQLTEEKVFGRLFYVEGDYLHYIPQKLTMGWRGKMDFYCVTYGGGIHVIDLLRWLVADEIVEVFSYGNQLATEGSQYKYPDCIVTLLMFEGGCVGKSTTSLAAVRPLFHSLKLYGTAGTFVNEHGPASLFWGDRFEDRQTMEESYPGVIKGDLIPSFIEAVLEDREPVVSLRDVFRSLSVCFAAWESYLTGKPVMVECVY